jgi:hypothetical protein
MELDDQRPDDNETTLTKETPGSEMTVYFIDCPSPAGAG